jgi:hypothetical protein
VRCRDAYELASCYSALGSRGYELEGVTGGEGVGNEHCFRRRIGPLLYTAICHRIPRHSFVRSVRWERRGVIAFVPKKGINRLLLTCQANRNAFRLSGRVFGRRDQGRIKAEDFVCLLSRRSSTSPVNCVVTLSLFIGNVLVFLVAVLTDHATYWETIVSRIISYCAVFAFDIETRNRQYCCGSASVNVHVREAHNYVFRVFDFCAFRVGRNRLVNGRKERNAT